ncbi:hypothetical protein [Niastella populi]|uniref:Uncharacterized protein n=1 Tax=Niastella populi TaxID=550983 RepID=A0A1V9FE45_9BACT|nr:hypothetical protein [Niastella populi]OQP56557.1 hypothetical protein A4R26_05190 [Niastella populi]
MKRSRVLIISFLILLLAALLFFFGGAMSMVPGWHTVIYPPWYAWVLVVIMTLFFGTIGYWLYIKRISRLNRLLFIIYAAVTTVVYFFLKFPHLPLQFVPYGSETFDNTALTIVRLLPVANWVLISTQVLLVGYVAGIILINNRKRT